MFVATADNSYHYSISTDLESNSIGHYKKLHESFKVYDRVYFVVIVYCLQCFGAVGWAAGRASGL